MRTISKNEGFTLAEILIAVALLSIVMAAIMTGILASLNLWARGDTEATLEENGRLILERITRGQYGMFGLKEAGVETLAISQEGRSVTFYVDKNDPPTVTTSDDTCCRFYLSVNRVYYDPDTTIAGNEVLAANFGRVEELIFSKNGGFVSIDLTMRDNPPASDLPIEIKFSTGVFLRKSRTKLY